MFKPITVFISKRFKQPKDEFLRYQMMKDTEIPEYIWKEALVVEDKEQGSEENHKYRMDVIWSFLSTLKNINGKPIFERLSKVVLTLPHLNASEQRVFSLINKNKTKFRPSLKLDGTLASIIMIRLANTQPCYKFEPPEQIIDSSKKATMVYNQAHCSKHS